VPEPDAAAPVDATRPFCELLDAVAARTPAPGGGSSAAWTAALAAALVEMAAGFTLARDEYVGVHERMGAIAARAGELRGSALELAEQELRAYGPVLEAQQLPREDPSRGDRIANALSLAADSPLAIARNAAELAGLAAEVATEGSRWLEGDAVVGTFLADAACRAAARLVEINRRSAPGDPRLAEAEQLSAEAVAARERARPPSAH
jgi:formiminotetrahydrofolate cyclodeaminase